MDHVDKATDSGLEVLLPVLTDVGTIDVMIRPDLSGSSLPPILLGYDAAHARHQAAISRMKAIKGKARGDASILLKLAMPRGVVLGIASVEISTPKRLVPLCG